MAIADRQPAVEPLAGSSKEAHMNEFSRKRFVQGGGALVVGFAILGAGVGAKAAEATGDDQFASDGPYDPQQLDSWLVIHADNTVSVKLGKVEFGQGANTGLLMIAAEELDLDFSQVRRIINDTELTPNQGITASSSSIQEGGKQTRAAAAAAKLALLRLASAQLGVDASTLSVSKGVVSGAGKTLTYGQLIGDKLFNVAVPASYNLAQAASGEAGPGLPPGAPGTKPVSQYGLVGKQSPPRIDIPAKVTGTSTYVQNIRIPGMLHARVVRPRGQGAYGAGTAPGVLSVDERSVAHLPDVRILRKGNFLAVAAPLEWIAIQAAAQLKVKWADRAPLPGVGNLFGAMRAQDKAGQTTLPPFLAIIGPTSSTFVPRYDLGNVDSGFAGAAKTVTATFTMEYQAHVPIGPSCSVADVTASGARVFSNTQHAYGTRSLVQAALQLAGLNLPLNRVRISFFEGSSSYGASPFDDCAQAAAVTSYLAGAPVRMQFMRWDEHGWDNYGPAQMLDVRGAIDPQGNIVASDVTHFSIPFYTTDATTQQVGGAPVPLPFVFMDVTNLGGQYAIPNKRVALKGLPLLDNYFKVTFLRAPLSPGTQFAYEQLIDELAHAANLDPIAFRLQNMANNPFETRTGQPLTSDRWRRIVTEVARISGWQPRAAASQLDSSNVVHGRGIGLGGFAGTPAAIVAEIEVNKKTGKIVAKHLYGAQDTGLTVYPAGVENQAVGSMTQGASRALYDEVKFDRHGVTSLDWVTYPIMRFKEAPKITFSIVQRTDIPAVDRGNVTNDGILATGSGESPTAPVAAAIANAFFDATGVRIRSAPMTPARVRAALTAIKQASPAMAKEGR
jgi:CO/xanthine dehydrogenase Mo-binding subunit